MIVSVFDPLAVLMLVGYNWTLKRKEEPEAQDFFDRGKEIAKALDEARVPEGWQRVWQPKSEEWPKYELDDGPLTDEQIETIKEESGIPQEKREWHPSLNIDVSDALDKEIEKLFEGEDVIASPAPPPEPTLGVKTIEQEVEDLQKKPIEYDSAGRRITP